MSEIKVNSIKGVGASAAAITVNNTDGTCTANITNNLSNRRININGAMTVSQRSSSFAAVANDNYTLDRYKHKVGNSSAAFTVTKSTTSPDGFSNSLKYDCTTADTSIAANESVMLQHIIEGQDLQHLNYGTSAAKAMTISFHVRSNVTGNYAFFCYQRDGGRTFSKLYTINSADTWEKKTITIPADTSGQIDNDNGGSLELHWFLVAGTNSSGGTAYDTAWGSYTQNKTAGGHNVNIGSNTSNEWYITGVQLEVNSSGVATDFEHRSFGQELQLCKRYYEVFNPGLYVLGRYSSGSTGAAYNFHSFEVEKRAAPTSSFSGTFTSSGGYAGDPVFFQPDTRGVAIYSTNTVASGGILYLDDSGSAFCKFDAEL
jgi:hypothetical protein